MLGIDSPAQAGYGLIQGRWLFWIINLVGVACFAYIMVKRLAPLLRGQRDPRFDRPWVRMRRLLQFWLGQWRHPRYISAGIIHIFLFAGFIILVAHTTFLLSAGTSDHFTMSGGIYARTADYAATVVFLCMAVAILRRLLRPARYAVPARYGKSHAADAIFLLVLIAILMAADGLFAGSLAVRQQRQHLLVESPALLSLAWMFQSALAFSPPALLSNLYLGAYLAHQLAFFFLLCYRPFGIQFHVEISLFSVYFAKLDRGRLKPVRWGVSDERLDQVKSFGVKTFEDFTWKHMLDFYSCADCGRCSDQCPANTVGRPLSPRFLTIRARDYVFRHYPVVGRPRNGQPLVGGIYTEDEIWSCTTCGACEAECPLLIEYIDKIVDLRRGLVDGGRVPQSLQKPLKALESRGNPFGKVEKRRSDWAQGKARILDGDRNTEALFFADSITSFDGRMQSIGRAAVGILSAAGEDFGILGPAEKDSGHDVRRFGEEMLFMALRDHNTEAIQASGVRRIVTADPHAFNALKHDYRDVPPVEHISQFLARAIRHGRIKLNPVAGGELYAYHDPCYLGRHNGVYDEPRQVLDAIPGLRRVEMRRARDRSFCCGGGGLALFYEPEEEERMGVRRVRMAAEAGANVIVTACPFCMANIEDGIKVAGLEGKMAAIDLAELVQKQMRVA
ncbi:MAG TPA: (Fe-S)-binding protein [Bryobacteraceae bacterium]|nr:(Fe-S)-binding protein [Bryobacteraceae bacterium]